MELPDRKWRQHIRPSWVDESDPIFLTLCTKPRGVNQLATAESWTQLVSAAEHIRVHHAYTPRLLLAMPDHVHMIVHIPVNLGIDTFIRKYKRASAYGTGITWQRWAFEHRIRDLDSLSEKWSYILKNPERAGLTKNGIPWPYLKIWPSCIR